MQRPGISFIGIRCRDFSTCAPELYLALVSVLAQSSGPVCVVCCVFVVGGVSVSVLRERDSVCVYVSVCVCVCVCVYVCVCVCVYVCGVCMYTHGHTLSVERLALEVLSDLRLSPTPHTQRGSVTNGTRSVDGPRSQLDVADYLWF
jgi:hypothetical protein